MTLAMVSTPLHPYGTPSPDPRERERANAILARAASYNRPGRGLEGLYNIDQVGPLRTPPCGFPVLINQLYHSNPRAVPGTENDSTGLPQARTDLEVLNRLRQKSAFFGLVGFDFDGNGMLPAGGAVAKAFYRKKKSYRGVDDQEDVDIFLIGHTQETAGRAIATLAAYFYDQCSSVEVFRSRHCVTFKVVFKHKRGVYAEELFQVVLKLYENHGQVLHSFDLGPSAVGWHHGRLVLTELAKYAAETGIILLNLAARRQTLEERLAKYMNEKGFGLGLPDLLALPETPFAHLRDAGEGIFNFARLEVVVDTFASTDHALAACTCALVFDRVDVITSMSRHVNQNIDSLSSIYGHDSKVYTESDDYFLAHLLGLHDKRGPVTLSRAQYVPGMDILGLQTRLDPEHVFKMALAKAKLGNWYTRFSLKQTPIWCCVEAVLDYLPRGSNAVRTPDFTKLQAILGAEGAVQFMRYYARGGNLEAPEEANAVERGGECKPVDPYEALELLERLCAARIASVQLHMPPSVPDSVVQGGEIVTFPLRPLTPAEWFGSTHALAGEA
jgi:hypothetical protein